MTDDLAEFIAEPFHADMSALDWFLFYGLLLLIALLWHMVIRAFANL